VPDSGCRILIEEDFKKKLRRRESAFCKKGGFTTGDKLGEKGKGGSEGESEVQEKDIEAS